MKRRDSLTVSFCTPGTETPKWLLWHGKHFRVGQESELFEDEVDGLEVEYSHLGKLARTAHDFANYIAANAASLINYGERSSSCLAESTVKAVIGKHFAKRQQMQRTKRGAHLLLQTRTRVLDGTLRSEFERWYPSLANDNTDAIQATAA